MQGSRFVHLFASLAISFVAAAQDPATEWRDSLNAATVRADAARVTRSIERLQTDMRGVRGVVSPLGEGDLIRWAQGLPGVTTGADGSSAIYVRGGNMGNNLVTLDGVPVYGYSHLLGLTTIVPTDVIGNVSLAKGGFGGGPGNFTASHLAISTRTIDADRVRASASLNNFLAGATVEAPVARRMHFLLTGRISPLTLEYNALKGLIPGTLGDLNGFRAGVGDLYSKLTWDLGNGHTLDASSMLSRDRYAFSLDEDSNQNMGWGNLIGAIAYRRSRDEGRRTVGLRASLNSYSSSQQEVKMYRGELNDLSLKSEMTEAVLAFDRHRAFGERGRFSFDWGASARLAEFRPGQVASITNQTRTLLVSAYLHPAFDIPDRLHIGAAVTGNRFQRLTDEASQTIDPDLSFDLRLRLFKHLWLEGTADRIRQYYHTLEGLPVGWSLDMLVPSGATIAPETAVQGNLGLRLDARRHSFSAGGFYKEMENLVYYKQAQTLFSGALAAWEDHVDIGDGLSYGGEFLYEYQGRDLYARVAYTLSRTIRMNFDEINEGRPFNARFDRRHVLNATAQWRGWSAAFTYQSGHWENGAAQKYPMHIPGEEWTADWYSGVNNFHMPDVLRLDVGYQFGFEKWGLDHEVNLGICNVTNHFNPFMLYFDAKTENWKQMALLPILPNFSYRINF